MLASVIGASSALFVHLLPWPRSRASTLAWENLCRAEKHAAKAVYDLTQAYSLWNKTHVAASDADDGIMETTRGRAELLSQAEECVFTAEQACETVRKRKREMAWEITACTCTSVSRSMQCWGAPEMEDARVRDATRLTLLAGGLYLGVVACKSHTSRRGRDVLPDVHILREHAQLACDAARRQHQHFETEKQQLCWLVHLVDECKRQEDFLDRSLSPNFVNIARLVHQCTLVYSVAGNKHIISEQQEQVRLSRNNTLRVNIMCSLLSVLVNCIC